MAFAVAKRNVFTGLLHKEQKIYRKRSKTQPSLESPSDGEQTTRGDGLKALMRNPFGRSLSSQNSTGSCSDSLESPPPKSENHEEKKKLYMENTFEYTVKDGDELRSVAARFDTTPSIMKKINRLLVDMLFPGQVLRIPNKDFKFDDSAKSNSKKESGTVCKENNAADTRPYPGRVMRMESSCHSFVDESELPPKPLSIDEAHYLDQECFERFIKVESNYITDCQGIVDGTLIITPNAIMFDPNLSNKLVVEHGAEEYGMIAELDSLMSLAIYHDIEAIEMTERKKNDASIQLPEVYRSKTDEMEQEKLETSQQKDQTREDTTINPSNPFILNPTSLIGSSKDLHRLPEASTKANESIDLTNANSPPGEGSADLTGETETAVSQTVVEQDAKDFTTIVGNSSFYSLIDEEANTAVQTNKDTVFNQNSSVDESRRSRNSSSSVHLEGAVKLSDKPGLFQSFDEMFPDGLVIDTKEHYRKQHTLYLCLKVGRPVNKKLLKTGPIDSYCKKKRPQYWFTVPRDKVDHLYAFFIQWKPEAYGKDGDSMLGAGFVAIEDDGNAKSEDHIDADGYVPSQIDGTIAKDWEIVSNDEVRYRKSVTEIEEILELPELIGNSVILKEEHIHQLRKVLPTRIDGYPWKLVFGTEEHGFSLKTLYRHLSDIDSPVLLVILTTDDQIFGALSSCAFHTSDLFYGTGESFLFTFVNGFKKYPWCGANSLFNKGDFNCLSIGAGQGSYGLWLDGDLNIGRTQNCATYANDPLTGSEEEFHINQVEIWAFFDDY